MTRVYEARLNKDKARSLHVRESPESLFSSHETETGVALRVSSPPRADRQTGLECTRIHTQVGCRVVRSAPRGACLPLRAVGGCAYVHRGPPTEHVSIAAILVDSTQQHLTHIEHSRVLVHTGYCSALSLSFSHWEKAGSLKTDTSHDPCVSTWTFSIWFPRQHK